MQHSFRSDRPDLFGDRPLGGGQPFGVQVTLTGEEPEQHLDSDRATTVLSGGAPRVVSSEDFNRAGSVLVQLDSGTGEVVVSQDGFPSEGGGS